LAPYPFSVFDDAGMRKSPKSSIYDCFETVNILVDIDDLNATYIIIRGFLLHRVVWDHEETYNHIFYINTCGM